MRLLPQGLGLDPGGARASSATSCGTSGATRRSRSTTRTPSPAPRPSEAASLQGKFFEFERGLFADQENQRPSDIIRLARELGLDVERFERDLTSPEVTGRVRDDMLDAEAMGITAVPTLFINGRRHIGPYDSQSLIRALEQAEQAEQAAPAVDDATAAGDRA